MQTRPAEKDPQAVRSRARGRTFKIGLAAAWPLGLVIALVAVVLGAGVAVAVASGVSVAIGLNFVWVGVTFAMDDGAVDQHVRDTTGR